MPLELEEDELELLDDDEPLDEDEELLLELEEEDELELARVVMLTAGHLTEILFAASKALMA